MAAQHDDFPASKPLFKDSALDAYFEEKYCWFDDCDDQDPEGSAIAQALLNFVCHDDAEGLRKILSVCPSIDVDMFTRHREIPLLEACGLGYAECVEALLEAGADPNGKRPRFEIPALHYAATSGARGAPLVCELLVQWGANLEARGPSGLTPFLAACQSGFLDSAKTLASLGADVRALDGLGQTAPQLAERGARGGRSAVANWARSEIERQDLAALLDAAPSRRARSL
jgi:hypothetical protein